MHPLLKKLHVKSDKLVVLAAPRDLESVIAALGIPIERRVSGEYAVLAFVRGIDDIPPLAKTLTPAFDSDAPVWIAFPKKSSKKYTSDISRDYGWEPLGALGVEPVSGIAIDDDWSGLRFRKVDNIKTMTRSRTISAAGSVKAKPAKTSRSKKTMSKKTTPKSKR